MSDDDDDYEYLDARITRLEDAIGALCEHLKLVIERNEYRLSVEGKQEVTRKRIFPNHGHVVVTPESEYYKHPVGERKI